MSVSSDPHSPRSQPTERELQVARWISHGLTLEEAAAQMFISRATAKRAMSTLQAKLSAKRPAQAVAICLRYGLIT